MKKVNEILLKNTIFSNKERLPLFSLYAKKSEYSERFKTSKKYLVSKDHQTDKYLFRRVLFKPLV